MQTILFTGGSGFLGTNMKPVLQHQNHITSLGNTDFDDIKIDIAKEIPILNNKYEIVVHAAGKAHSVPKNKAEEKIFFDVNLQGTKNICKALELYGMPKSFIFVSSVAVYGVETGENISEDHPLNGTTPYAQSKMQAECFLQEWTSKHGVKLAIIRPSLIAGKKPPGNLGTMIHGIQTGKYFSIANGEARKSVVMASDIANLIPKLATIGGIYNLCDDRNPSFKELEQLISKQLNTKQPWSIPYWIAKSMAMVGDVLGSKAPINSLKLDKITKSLTFSNQKAKTALDWEPLDVLSNFKIF
jgi:nucleoside-diphosphate-sugar epimerase